MATKGMVGNGRAINTGIDKNWGSAEFLRVIDLVESMEFVRDETMDACESKGETIIYYGVAKLEASVDHKPPK